MKSQENFSTFTSNEIASLRRAVLLLTEEIIELKKTLRSSPGKDFKSKPYYTVKDLAKRLGRSPYTIRRWIRDGKIEAIKLNSGGPRDPYLIDCREVEELLEDSSTQERFLISN